MGQKENKMLEFAVVRYATYQEAEKAQMDLNQRRLGSHSIRAVFCTPGKSAYDLYEMYAKERVSKRIFISHVVAAACSYMKCVFVFPLQKRLCTGRICVHCLHFYCNTISSS